LPRKAPGTPRCSEFADFGLASVIDAEYISILFDHLLITHFSFNPPPGVWSDFMEEIR